MRNEEAGNGKDLVSRRREMRERKRARRRVGTWQEVTFISERTIII
jgi:hypothetical protein